jgi:ERCC4-type nuclease
MLAKWSEKPEHNSLSKRSNPRSSWGHVENKDWGVHLLQSFEGVGVDKAAAIWDHFGGVPFSWQVTEKELCQVPGIGKTLAQRMINAMRKVEE